VPAQSKIPLKIATALSIINLLSKGTVQIRAVVPITNKILKILLPTIFPIAIPTFPFLAAVTDVTSSGREVPKATIVSPINRSLYFF
jgi:hypothetical protein